VQAVMLSHAFYAAFDPVTPASLSPTVVIALLRDQLGYQGVAMTDDLAAGAISAGQGAPAAAVEALAAGEDLIVISDPALAQSAQQEILRAVEVGDIPAQRLTQAAARVVEMKRQAGLVEAK
jgi:beta-N-acetylhexosaminidase